MNGYRVRDFQKAPGVNFQFVGENIGVPPCYSSKRKKIGASDPRFKRVLHTETRGDACAELDDEKTPSLQKINRVAEEHMNEDRILAEKVISYLKSPNDAALFGSSNLKRFDDQDISQRGLSEMVTRDVGLKMPIKFFPGCDPSSAPLSGSFPDPPLLDNFRDVQKTKINSKTNLKRSASDCTLHTKNTYVDENEEEISHRARPFPSTTRINRVHNWIKDYKMMPEKRRSVITVIGQTQTKPFSKILNEINQRRKLAKELDKHALCEAIMESVENPPDVKNLVAKVDFVLPDGKVLYSAEKVYLCKESSKYKIEKDFEELGQKSMDHSDTNDSRKKCDMIPERDSSISQIGKRSRTRRPIKKLITPEKEKIQLKDKIKSICARNSSMLLRSCWLLLCLVLCISGIYCTLKSSTTVTFPEFFKPKTTPWYEKLLF